MKKTLDGLARACHTIADFYAHSSYAHFARKDGAGHLLLFDGMTTDDRFAAIPTMASRTSTFTTRRASP